MSQLFEDLFNIDRSIVGKGQLTFLNRLSRELPLTIHSFNSGMKCYDWTIPQEWRVVHARLVDETGKIIIDFNNNPLHLLNYSNSFLGKVSWEKLQKHLYYDAKNPAAIPYRTSYYSPNWGFCLQYAQFKELKPGNYFVDIKTNFTPGKLYAGEVVIPGKSKKEVLLSSYICHPRQANDGLSGVILLTHLYKLLKKRKLKYTYQFVFIPETIGSIVLLSQKIIQPVNIEYALVATCVGIGHTLNYKKTYLGNSSLDNVVTSVLEKRRFENNTQFLLHDFLPVGSEERQYSSAKVRIPTGSLMRTPYHDFKGYHTSLDNMENVSPALIRETEEIYCEIILTYEKQKKFIAHTEGGEPFLTKYNLYRTIGGKPHGNIHELRNWIIHLADGTNTELDIAARSGYPLEEIKYSVKELLTKKVIRCVD